MFRRVMTTGVVSALVLISGCGPLLESPVPESPGFCEGTIGDRVIAHPVNPKESFFYRLDYDFGREGTRFYIQVGNPEDIAAYRPVLWMNGALNDMSDDVPYGEHPLPVGDGNDVVSSFHLESDPAEPRFTGGVWDITHGYDRTLAGKMTLNFSDGSRVQCDVKLERDSSRDTDD